MTTSLLDAPKQINQQPEFSIRTEADIFLPQSYEEQAEVLERIKRLQMNDGLFFVKFIFSPGFTESDIVVSPAKRFHNTNIRDRENGALILEAGQLSIPTNKVRGRIPILYKHSLDELNSAMDGVPGEFLYHKTAKWNRAITCFYVSPKDAIIEVL